MNRVQIEPWRIWRLSPIDDYSETVFCVGNGRLGVRGFGAWEKKKTPQAHALFRAGLFSQIKPGITDMVQLPDALSLLPADQTPGQVLQTLNMKTGVYSQEWETPRARYRMERLASMADSRLILQRLTISANETGAFKVCAAADAQVSNLPVHDDQMTASTELAQLLALDEITADHMTLHTLAENTRVTVQWEVFAPGARRQAARINGGCAEETFSFALEAGEQATIEKRVHILVEGETSKKGAGDPWHDSEKAWAALWRDADVAVNADDTTLQGALRYNIFELLCNNAADDRKVSIGARGLTHGRYKGNTFWDTDIFMFPFYLWTRPAAARSLLEYRLDRLPAAKALAARQNLLGARYPWMCSSSGSEQCESWDIGLCEVHITGDVAYAAQRYMEVAGGEGISQAQIAELYRETARYWRSRLTYEPRTDRYSSFFVKGPDEYCGAAINNTFTNFMARNNLRLALRHGGLDAREADETQRTEARVTLLYDEKRALYLQDETLDRLPPFMKEKDGPAYKSVCFDRMQRYRALKQADLVLLMTLFPADFTLAQKMAVFEAYEPITVHDSTLSYGTHAQLALRLGLWDKAREYLQKGVYLDLYDVMGNTGGEGIHLAAMGAAWQAIVFGAAGLWAEDGRLTLEPSLPKEIKSISFHGYFQGRRYRFDADEGGGHITQEA